MMTHFYIRRRGWFFLAFIFASIVIIFTINDSGTYSPKVVNKSIIKPTVSIPTCPRMDLFYFKDSDGVIRRCIP